MVFQKFEDILAWQKAQLLAISIYSLFKDNRDFGFKDQISRAVISISNNIAEGFDRQSNKEFVRFLYIALGSNSEVRSMLFLAEKLHYINNQNLEKLVNESIEISKLIHGLIKYLKTTTRLKK